MNCVLLSLATMLGADDELRLAAAVKFHYQGTVAQAQRDRSQQTAGKGFDLTLLTVAADSDSAEFYWLVDEQGAGSFGWAERFGRLTQAAAAPVAGVQGPAVLYDYGTGKHVVPLPAPQLALPENAELNASWSRDGFDYEIVRSQDVDGRKCWVVEVRNQFGPQRKAWVDRVTLLVIQHEDRVFMNQGTEYRLAIKLTDVETLSPDAFAAESAGFAALVDLRGKLKRPPRSPDDAMTPDQVAQLAKYLPAAKQAIGGGALGRLVAAAERDLTRQTSRAHALDEIIAKQIGRTIEPFEAAGLDGAKLTADDLREGVAILHFWDYRDEPLKEPYGQVGYLEFLYAKHKAAGVKVYGVAVDGRFHQQADIKAATTGVRRLRNFMNLTYPIVFDGGELIGQFGDPRPVGGELPLFVVVGPGGKVAHYKVGHYAVDREAGLKELDAVVGTLLRSAPDGTRR